MLLIAIIPMINTYEGISLILTTNKEREKKERIKKADNQVSKETKKKANKQKKK